MQKAFDDEAISNVNMMLYSEKAKEEGFNAIGDKLNEIAHNNMAHAKIWLNELGKSSTTEENLQNSIDSHKEEIEFYTDWQQEDDSPQLKAIIQVKEAQLEDLQESLNQMDTETMFITPKSSEWYCTNCGFIAKGKRCPLYCPLCGCHQGYFKIYKRRYIDNN